MAISVSMARANTSHGIGVSSRQHEADDAVAVRGFRHEFIALIGGRLGQPRRIERAVHRLQDFGAGIELAQLRRQRSAAPAPAISVLVITSRSARIACLRASADHPSVSRAGHRVHHRHHRLDMEHVAQRAVGGEGLQDGRGIGEARGLDHDAPEIRQFAALALDHHAAQRALQIAARDAAQAAIAEQHRLVGALAQQRVVDAGGAEFVDHHRGALPLRRRQERAQQRGLAGAEEAGHHRHRHFRARARA